MRRRIAALAVIMAASVASAADSPKWDITRTTAPETSAEAAALQWTVKKVVDKVTPATIAVFYGAGAGSGAIISEDGLVLTAAHVVTPQAVGFGGGGRRGGGGNDDRPIPKSVRLQLADGTQVKGVVLGRNSGMDSAMVKITDPIPKNAKWPGATDGKWPAVDLGKSDALKKGQWVVALGHPGGPKQDRRAPVRLGQMMRVNGSSRIVSDCTLVGGDSGGPLFDLEGKLIGIHSSIGNDLASNNHIPTHIFQRDWKRLLRGDFFNASSNARMGIVLAGDEKDNSRGKAKPLIEEVIEGTPADQAGLKAGDLVLEFKGEKVETSEDIDQMMGGMKPGEKVLIKVKRGNDLYELELTLAKRESR